MVVPADGLSAGTIPATQMLYNGTALDRERSNYDLTLLASAARTATLSSPGQFNYNGHGVIVYLSITAASGTGGLSVRINGTNPVTGTGVQLNTAPTAIIATGIYGYEVSPGGSTAGNTGSGFLVQRTAGSVPRSWSVTIVHGDASSYTYSVGASVIR